MTTGNETDRKKLSLSGRGTLSLGKSADTDQVKQSFSADAPKQFRLSADANAVPVLAASEAIRQFEFGRAGTPDKGSERRFAPAGGGCCAAKAPAEPVLDTASEPAPSLYRLSSLLIGVKPSLKRCGRSRQPKTAFVTRKPRGAPKRPLPARRAKADQAAARPAETRSAPAARAADPAQPAPAEDDFDGRRTRRRSLGCLRLRIGARHLLRTAVESSAAGLAS